MRLTATVIESLKPQARRYERSDPAVPGLQVRVEPTGAKHWQLRYYWRGKRQKLALGTWPKGREPGMTLEQARAEAIRARELLEAGIDPRRAPRTKRAGVPHAKLLPARRDVPPAPALVASAPGERTGQRVADRSWEAALTDPIIRAALAEPHSVATLAHEYVTGHVRKQRRRPEYVERFLAADVLPVWGTRDARTITPREVVELLDGIVHRGSPAMANRGAGVLSQAFRYGVHRAIVETSPVQLLYRPGGKEKPRERVLSDDELADFLHNVETVSRFQTGAAARSPRMAHVLRLLLLTGQRRGELALARWQDLTLTGKAPVWRIPAEHSKTGAPHTVPLVPAAVREFEALHTFAGGSVFVFPTEDGKAAADAKLITRNVSRNAARFAAVGVQPFAVHDLRRTCRTGLAKLGVPHDVAERVLNHKLPQMRETYDRHEPLDEMRAALVKWAHHLATLERKGASRAKNKAHGG